MQLRAKVLPKQHRFIKSQADFAMYCGGVGAGKSIADVSLAISDALDYPGIDIMACSPTYGMLRDTLLREFKMHCPSFLLHKFVEAPYPEAVFKPKDGRQSTIRFRAFDDALKPRGLTVGEMIIDEAVKMPEDVFDELTLNRVRQIGMPNRKRISTNPDSKLHYLYKRYVEPWEAGDIGGTDFEYIHTTTFDNYLLPENYLAQMRRLEFTRPALYRRMVLGEWGDFDEDTIGAFEPIDGFSSEYLVAWFDTSYSDRTKSDHTALSIVGISPKRGVPTHAWPIEFTGMSWQKSITNTDVIMESLAFLDRFKPIEVVLESQLADSTQVFIDRFQQAERDMGLKIKNTWGWEHQKSGNKHERIMLYVGGNRDRIKVLKGTNKEFLYAITNYKKKTKEHDDEPDSLAGAIYRWQTSPILKGLFESMAG